MRWWIRERWGAQAYPNLLLLHCRQHGAHFFMDEIDGLERPQHDLEFDNPALVVSFHDVHAVDQHAINLGFKLQHGIVCADNLAHITECGIEQNHERPGQIGFDQRFSLLRCMHHGRQKDGIVGQQIIKAGCVLRAHELMLCFKRMSLHEVFSLIRSRAWSQACSTTE